MDAELLAPALFTIKLGLYGSALLAAGLALHASLSIVAPDSRAQVLRGAGLAALAALLFAAFRLGLINVQLGGVEALLDAATWSWTWPVLGPSSTAIAIGAAALATAWWLRSRIAAGIGAATLALSFALTGHSQGLNPPGLAPWAVALHVLTAAFWFTGPVTLWPSRKLQEQALIARVTRFSDFAVAAIPILFTLGLWLAWRLAGGWAPLLMSGYGQLLLAKLALASAALALGAYNKTIVAGRLRATPEAGRRALRLTLGLDIALFALALGVIAAATSLTGPPTP